VPQVRGRTRHLAEQFVASIDQERDVLEILAGQRIVATAICERLELRREETT
jgi:hypothetical protein